VLDQGVEWSPAVKYLGIILDKKLVLNQHINYTIEKVNKVVKILYPMLSRKSRLNTDNKILIYKQILTPILSYASSIFENVAKVASDTIQNYQTDSSSSLAYKHNTDSSSH
jgi:hypothetical protein